MTPRPAPGCIDHEALYTRIDETEQRLIGLLKWAATTVLGIVLVFSGYVGKTNDRIQERQIETSSAFAEIRETNKHVSDQLSSLYSLVYQRTSEVEKELDQHEREPDAHYRHNGSGATPQQSAFRL